MENEFIPYEQALALKELGFDEPCVLYWRPEMDGSMHMFCHSDCYFWDAIGSNNSDNAKWVTCTAPLYQQAFRWFREKHNWQHSIDPTADQHSRQLGYNYWIWNYKTGEEHWTMPKNRPTGDWEYETYEQAELECLRKLIGIVKNK